jgi:hypothetical protein
MFRPGIKPGPPWWEATTIEKIPTKYEQLVNSYSEHLYMSPRHGSPQCICLHDHT